MAADHAANRDRILAAPSRPRPRPGPWRALAAGALAVMLTGCSVTLYSVTWGGPMTQADCDALPEAEARTVQACREFEYVESLEDYNAAGGYADACGDLPPLIGDDC